MNVTDLNIQRSNVQTVDGEQQLMQVENHLNVWVALQMNARRTKMICPKCGYDWEYKGKSNFYISCPRCRSNINLQKPKDKSSVRREWK